MGEGEISRRAALTAAAGLVAGLAATGIAASTGTLPTGVELLRSAAASGVGPATVGGVVRREQVHSAARGRAVSLVTITPIGTRPAGLPVCVALHGLNGDAMSLVASGLPGFLSTAVARRTTRPFALVAVDGGNSYWHEHTRGDDPMGMLVDELPRWLRERGLRPTPFAATGVSMGGFGALHYARVRAERAMPLDAVGVVAPALITTWREMSKRRAFRGPDDWARYDPLRNLPALGQVPIGLWCGTEDRFITGAREFIATGRPTVASLGPGGHDDAYFRPAWPEVLTFLGRHHPHPT
jgi:S-formylglutathione hydrolase FrmB